MVRELTADKLIEIFLKKWYVIVSITLLFTLATFLFSAFLIEDEYTSEGTMIVTNNQDESKEISKTDLDASARLVETYRILLTSTKFCEKISQDIGSVYSATDVQKALSLSSINDTEVLSVKATTTSRELSQQITQSVLDNAKEEIASVSEAYHVKIIDDAAYPQNRSYPNVSFNTVLGFLLGVIFSVVFILLRTMFDTKIKDEQELKSKYNIPSLGAIPNINGGKKK